MTAFLNNYAENNRFFDSTTLEHLAATFKSNFNKCIELYGEYTFKTFDENKKRMKSNTALFDAQMISMSIVQPSMEQIENTDKNMVVDRLNELLGNEEFYNSITKGTTDRNTVHKRINEYTEFLRNLLD